MHRARQFIVPFFCLLAISLLGGCMYDRSDDIPADAAIPAAGEKQLQFTASQTGMVYVYDRNNNHLLYSGQINRGQMLTVEPERDRITIDGRTVREHGINNADTRRIFFKPTQATDERVIIEEHRDSR